MRQSKKFAVPSFLSDQVSQEIYERWLRRKAQAHVRRDRLRKNKTAVGEPYRLAIHRAVMESNGRDAYTGQMLDWSLLSKYDNEKSKKHGRKYKNQFARLPTVDHVGDGTGKADFKICGWRTNDAKNDLQKSQFIALCKAVLRHNGYTVMKPGYKNTNKNKYL